MHNLVREPDTHKWLLHFAEPLSLITLAITALVCGRYTNNTVNRARYFMLFLVITLTITFYNFVMPLYGFIISLPLKIFKLLLIHTVVGHVSYVPQVLPTAPGWLQAGQLLSRNCSYALLYTLLSGTLSSPSCAIWAVILVRSPTKP